MQQKITGTSDIIWVDLLNSLQYIQNMSYLSYDLSAIKIPNIIKTPYINYYQRDKCVTWYISNIKMITSDQMRPNIIQIMKRMSRKESSRRVHHFSFLR